MYIVLGATGHVGSAVAERLLKAQMPVTVVTPKLENAQQWQQKGAVVALADVHDVKLLRHLFNTGERLFLLNPPASPGTDTVKEEKKTVASILHALRGSTIKNIVAQSTYGARPGEDLGDLGVLYELEQGLEESGIPFTVVRAAYYMSNWNASLESCLAEGRLYSFLPADLSLAMVAPADIGAIAAQLLMAPVEDNNRVYVEGPQHYSPTDVARAFSIALSKEVQVTTIPRDSWEKTMQSVGFSAPAAASFAAMTELVLQKDLEVPVDPLKGSTTIETYIEHLVRTRRSEDNGA